MPDGDQEVLDLESTSSENVAPATILIVDDVASHRAHLMAVLGQQGHHLRQARNGRQGLRIARRGKVDLVITDVLMPVMDGYEFVRQLRDDPATAKIPVLFYTAPYGEREAWARAREDSVAYVLRKPGESTDVLNIVRKLLDGELRADAQRDPPDPKVQEQLALVTERLSIRAGELRVTNARLRAIINIGLELATERDDPQLLHRVCEAARDLFGASYATVGIVDDVEHRLTRMKVCGTEASAGLTEGEPVPGILSLALAMQAPQRGVNPGGDPRALGLPEAHPPIQAYLAVPIMSPVRRYGWICLVANEGRAFSAEDEQLLLVLGGQVGRLYQLQHEIAERRHAEHALHHSERVNVGLIEHLPHRILVKDRNSDILFCNSNFASDLGLTPKEVVGKNAFAFYAPELAEAHHRDDREVMTHGITRSIEVDYEVAGKTRSVHSTRVPFRDEHGKIVGVIVVFEDITERKRQEAQFRQSQKMEAVGRLAGGIAHDFNNILTVILGHCEMFTADLPPGAAARDDIEAIHRAGMSAATLTSQLLAVSRKQVVKLVLLDLNTVVSGIQSMLRRLIPEDVRMVMTLQSNLAPVRADRGQIEQIVMNLVVNARDAMAKGGVLTITTAEVELDENYPKTHLAVPPGRYVILTVSDTGTGMTPEVQSRLFEPFFTTKGVGKGTGLGLATVHGIVQQHGGSIEVYSELSQGTSVHVYFPQSVGLVEEPLDFAQGTVNYSGTESVLVVDDEVGIGELARRLLERRGYTVHVASSQLEAKALLAAHAEIVLLLTDVIMPGASGPELIRRLRATRPELRVVYMSGYTEDAMLQHGIIHERFSFLHKPFTSQSLARKVREALDRVA